MSEKLKSAEQYAREAWCKLSLGNIATPATDHRETGAVARPANFEAVVKELEPFFAEARREVAAELQKSIEWLNDQLQTSIREQLRLQKELDEARETLNRPVLIQQDRPSETETGRFDCVAATPKGFRDLYWCWIINEPGVAKGDGTCSECGYNVRDLDDRHTFIAHIRKP